MLDLFSLEGKIAVVTGASSGIGADAAIAYAEAGADVALLARRIDKLEETKQAVEALGKRALPVVCDVTDEESVKTAIEKVIEEFGTIDILLSNAGICIFGGVETLSLEDWDKVVQTNLTGAFLVAKNVLPHMREKKYGKIVFTSSLAAINGDRSEFSWRHSYNATKAGLKGLAAALGTSYAPYNITVNAIAPGFIDSGMAHLVLENDEVKDAIVLEIPMGRVGNRDELKGTLIYLSSEASSFVTGQFLLVDGGASVC